ncbi:Hypothetical predicted protein [Paramuricea clavata]|uniref:Uncharacterized protein n=1 Tax=Paramuricea clavata TaxID=317549 RepID=A0A6S7IL56_PARCT|nr:Hypothetical predicted protein [Paramuricea clavata]
MAKLKETVLLGWPDKISEVDPDLQEYWNFRDELCICDGHLLKGDRLITPSALRPEMSEEFEVHLLVPISQEKPEEFKRELDRDPIMAKLKETVLLGWPDKISEVDPDLQEYWNFRDELCICDGHLLKCDRLITPSALRPEMVDKIHSSHLGMEKCLN